MGRIFKKLLNWVLGDYLLGVDKKNVRASLFRGKVILEKLSFNPKIMNMLNLPLKIIYSYLGKLEMTIPWFSITTKPIEITLDELFIVLIPYRVNNLNPYEQAISELDAIHKECATQLEVADAINDDNHGERQEEEPSINTGYQKTFIKIIDHIKITIKNIHIRFEDSEQKITCGLSLYKICIYSIHNEREREFKDEYSQNILKDKIHKKIEVIDCSLYWRTKEFEENFIEKMDKKSNYAKRLFMVNTIVIKSIDHRHLLHHNTMQLQTSQPINNTISIAESQSLPNLSCIPLGQLNPSLNIDPLPTSIIMAGHKEESKQDNQLKSISLLKNQQMTCCIDDHKRINPFFPDFKTMNYEEDCIFCINTNCTFITRIYTKPDQDKDPFYFFGITLKNLDIIINKSQYQQVQDVLEYLFWLNARKYYIRRSPINAESIPALRDEFKNLFWDLLKDINQIYVPWDIELENPLYYKKSQRLKELLILLPEADMKEVATENILAFIKLKLGQNINQQKKRKFWRSVRFNKKEMEKEEEEIQKLQDMIDKYLEQDRLKADKKPTDGFMFQISIEIERAKIFLKNDPMPEFQEGILMAFKDIKVQTSNYERYKGAASVIIAEIADMQVAFTSRPLTKQKWHKIIILQKISKPNPNVGRHNSDSPTKIDYSDFLSCTFKDFGATAIETNLEEDFFKDSQNDTGIIIKLDWRLKNSDSKQYLDFFLNAEGIEIIYLASAVSMVFKFLELERIEKRNMVDSWLREKFIDVTEQVRVRVQTYVQENSDAMKININVESSVIIIPINYQDEKSSDAWIVKLGNLIVNTLAKDEKKPEESFYDIFRIILDDFNLRYYDEIKTYYQTKGFEKFLKSKNNHQKTTKSILIKEDSDLYKSGITNIIQKIDIEFKLYYLNEQNQLAHEDATRLKMLLSLEQININLTKEQFLKALSIMDTIDWTQDYEYHFILEDRKYKLLLNNQGIYQLYMKETAIPKIQSKWDSYFGILSGFYMYLFKDLKSVRPDHTVFLKGVELALDNNCQEYKYVLRVKSKYVDAYFAFESIEKRNQLIRQVEANHKEFVIGHQNYPSLETDLREKDKWELEQQQKEAQKKMNVIQVDFQFYFKGIQMNFRSDEDYKLYTNAILEGVKLYYISRTMDFMIHIQLSGCSVQDFTRSHSEKEVKYLMISKKKYEKDAAEDKYIDWIDIYFRAFSDNHPYFIKNKIKSEIDIKFSYMYAEWRHELLIILANFLVHHNLRNKKKLEITKKIVEPSKRARARKLQEEVEAKSLSHEEFIKKKSREDIILMQMRIKFGEFNLLLLTTKHYLNLASIHTNKLQMIVDIQNDAMLIKGSLENIQILDLTNFQQRENDLINIIPNELVGIYGQNSVLEFKICIYNKPIKINNILYKIEASMNINHIKVNYLHQVFMRLIKYVVNISMTFLGALQIGKPKSYEMSSDSSEYKQDIILKRINQPIFFKIDVCIYHPRIILKPLVHSNVAFEFDMGKIHCYNEIFMDKSRILIGIPGIQHINCQVIHVQTSNMTFTKIVNNHYQNDGERTIISKDFMVRINVKMILKFSDYVELLAYQNKNEITETIDNSITTEGFSDTFFLKLSQEDYLDLMDCVFFNILYDDDRNHIFGVSSEMEKIPIKIANPDQDIKGLEKKDKNTMLFNPNDCVDNQDDKKNPQSPLVITWGFGSILILLYDQLLGLPLSQISLKYINFKVSLQEDTKKIDLMLNRINAYYYDELDKLSLIERTYIGELDQESIVYNNKYDKDLLKDLLISKMNINFTQKEIPDLHLQYLITKPLQEFQIDLNNINLIVYAQLLFRLKEFFICTIQPNIKKIKEDLDNTSETIVIANKPLSKSSYKVTLNQGKIIIPAAYHDYYLFIKTKAINFDLTFIDLGHLLFTLREFQECSNMIVSIDKQEIFLCKIKELNDIVNNNVMEIKAQSAIQKRYIIFSYSFIFTSTNYSLWDIQNFLQIIRNNTKAILDKIIIGVSSSDCLILYQIVKNLMSQYDIYSNYPRFSQTRKNTKMINIWLQVPQSGETLAKSKTIENEIIFQYEGIQIRILNDFGNSFVPMLDLCIHSTLSDQAFYYLKVKDTFAMKGYITVSASFFNPKISKWEPLIEKWTLHYGLDNVPIYEMQAEKPTNNSLTINLSNSSEELNINITQETLSLLLSIFQDCQKKLGVLALEPNQKFQQCRSIKLVELPIHQDDIIQNVSSYIILNNTGYTIEIEPKTSNLVQPGPNRLLMSPLKLENTDQADLLIETNIEEIFNSSINNNDDHLSLIELRLKIYHPQLGLIATDYIEIQDSGTKLIKIEVFNNEELNLMNQYHLICAVTLKNCKKLIHFSSTILFKNELDSPISVLLYNKHKEDLSRSYMVKMNDYFGIPFDRFDDKLAIMLNINDQALQSSYYEIGDLQQLFSNELNIGNHYIQIRTINKAYTTIFVFEPLLIIKNCLPFDCLFNLESDKFEELLDPNNKKKELITLGTQEYRMIYKFSKEDKVYIKVQLGPNLQSDKIQLLPLQKSQTKNSQKIQKEENNDDDNIEKSIKLYNTHDNTAIDLLIFMHKAFESPKKAIFYLSKCIIDETMQNLGFYLEEDIPLSHKRMLSHGINLDFGKRLIMIDDNIKSIRIKSHYEGSSLSKEIKLDKLGQDEVYVYNAHDKKISFNLGVDIVSLLCNEDYMLYTKIISISPRYVFINKTGYDLGIHQVNHINNMIYLHQDSRIPFHFNLDIKEKFVFLKIIDLEEHKENSEWYSSGILDANTLGDTCFYIKNKNGIDIKYFTLNVTQERATYFLSIQEAKHTMYEIHNDFQNYPIVINQVDYLDQQFYINIKSKIPFAWFSPAKTNLIALKIIVDNTASSETTIDLNTIKLVKTVKVRTRNGDLTFTYYVKIRGSVKVLIVNYQKTIKAEEPKSMISMQLLGSFKGIGISLVSTHKNKRVDVIYLSIGPLYFALVETSKSRTFQFRIKYLTIDNQVNLNAKYPVMLYPDYMLNDNLANKKYTFDLLIIMKKNKDTDDIPYLLNIVMHLAEMSFYIDGSTLIIIADLFQSLNKIMKKYIKTEIKTYQYMFFEANHKKEIIENTNQNRKIITWKNFNSSTATQYIYIKRLIIYPIKISITFKALSLPKDDSFLINLTTNILGRTLINFERAPVTLKGIYIQSLHGAIDDMSMQILKKYYTSIAESALGFIFANNLLGNPIKLAEKITTGISDLIDDSAESFNDGPLESGLRLAANTGSLARKTAGATFDSLHNLSETIATGLTGMAGDQEFVQLRDRWVNTGENINMINGTYQAVKTVGKYIENGITGLIKKPAEGIQKEGFKGLIKGLITGARGFVFKPIAGVFDGISKISEGVSNTISDDIDYLLARKRLPRIFYGSDQAMRAYSEADALIFYFLILESKEDYEKIRIIEVIYITETDQILKEHNGNFCVVLTIQYLFLININEKRIIWKIKSQNIQNIVMDVASINIESRVMVKSLAAEQREIKLIPCLDDHSKLIIYNKLKKYLKNFIN